PDGAHGPGARRGILRARGCLPGRGGGWGGGEPVGGGRAADPPAGGGGPPGVPRLRQRARGAARGAAHPAALGRRRAPIARRVGGISIYRELTHLYLGGENGRPRDQIHV